jgi:Family of unknown function (DUF6502)
MELNETLVTLLLPIGRLMLKGGLGIGDLIRAGKQAYLRAAIASVTSAGLRTNASHLSVVTGLTRKEVTAILNELKGLPIPRRGEAKEQRATRVLRGWKLDPRFCDAKGEPAKLPLRGERESFSALVKMYGGDVTPNSVLKELERMSAVAFSKSRRVRLRPSRVVAKSTEHMTDLARLFPDFANTVSPDNPIDERPLFFGFRDSAVDSAVQAAKFQRTFSNRAAALLQGVQQWLVSQNQTQQAKTVAGNRRWRVGIGVYLVQGSEEVGPPRPKARSVSIGQSTRSRGRSHRAP